MADPTYASAPGGLPPQTQLLTGRAVFTESYAVIPRGTMTDIVTSFLPEWRGARAWIIARPMSGFAETFSQAIVELAPGGGSAAPEPQPEVQGVVFVTGGHGRLEIGSETFALEAGSYAYLAPGATWALHQTGDAPMTFHWIRKRYVPAPGLATPTSFVTHERDVADTAMPDTDGVWATKRFVAPDDLAHDMHVNIVTFQPGGVIPFAETHVMEHGLYVLEGKAVYRLNDDWVEVEAGDFMWLRAFCPQACYAGGPGPFRYLLYKDVNRQIML